MTVEWSHLNTLNSGLYAVSNRMKMRLEKQAGWSSKEVEEMLAAEVRTELRMEADAMGNQALSKQIYKTMNMQLPLSPPPPSDAQVSPSTAWPRSARPDLGLNRWAWYAILASLASFVVGLVLGSI